MHKSWILVVEDDADLRDHVLLPGLKASGFEHVRGAGSALEAYRAMLTQSVAVFVLDVGLPDEDGFEVARHVRSASDAGIVMLTGWRKDTIDHVEGLDIGADAYLTKPVDIELLAATIRSVLRRKQQAAPSSGAASEPTWALSSDGWFLTAADGTQIPLTRIERAFLRLLYAHAGQVVERQAIIAALEKESKDDGGDFDPHRIELLVHRLRKKAAKATGEPLPLKTIRGTGYAVAAG